MMKDVFGDRWCLNFACEGHEVRVFGNLAARLPVVYLHTIADEGADIWRRCLDSGTPPFVLVEVSVPQWNDDMTPWPGPALRHGAQPFGGGADAYLDTLSRCIVPKVERMMAFAPAWRGIAGYSLAGLFALYAAWTTPLFDRVASMSGSLWYWGFAEYLRDAAPLSPLRYAYLSLGKEEGKTKDPTLAAVDECTQWVKACLGDRGVAVTYESNEGNHFSDPEGRTAKGVHAIVAAE